MNLKSLLIKKIALTLIFLLIFLPISTNKVFAQTRTPQQRGFSLRISVDKQTVNSNDTFRINIEVENTSNTTINNFEIRTPFARSIADAILDRESPSFNKVLDTIEFPAGFNSRSWIINSFEPGQEETFSINYRVSANPTIQNGLVAKYTLPASWVDPAGVRSNVLIETKDFRVDTYINRVYSSSFNTQLPSLQSLNTPLSLIELNSKYRFNGSKTTDFKTINAQNIASFPNFTLESQDILIEWLQPLDLSAQTTASQFSNLDNNLKTTWGNIEFNNANLTFLQGKPIRVTFKNANFVNEPQLKRGNNIIKLSDANAIFQVSNRTISLELPQIENLAIVPDIILDESVIETESDFVNITGKVSDPRSPLIFTFGEKSQTLSVIDISTGAFSFRVPVNEESMQVEVSTKYSNEEETKKVVIIRKNQAEETNSNPIEENRTINLLFNPITTILLLIAIALGSALVGYFYYIYKKKKKDEKIDLKTDPVIISSISGIGTKPESDDKNTDVKEDLSKLKDKYTIKEEDKIDSDDSNLKKE
jgi:hypothetical protein